MCTVPLAKDFHEEITRNIIKMHKITIPEYDENNFKQNEKCLLEGNIVFDYIIPDNFTKIYNSSLFNRNSKNSSD